MKRDTKQQDANSCRTSRCSNQRISRRIALRHGAGHQTWHVALHRIVGGATALDVCCIGNLVRTRIEGRYSGRREKFLAAIIARFTQLLFDDGFRNVAFCRTITQQVAALWRGLWTDYPNSMSAGGDLRLSHRLGGGSVDLDFLKRKSWPGVAAQFIRIAPPSMYDFALTKSSNYFALHDILRLDGETRVPGLPTSYIKDLRNKITFLPAGCDIKGWCRISKSASFVSVYLEQSEAERERIDLSRLPPTLAFEDQMLRSALLRFQAILHDPALDLPGYAETLGMLLTFEMGRLGSQPKHASPHQGGLTPRQVRLITDYIEGRLDNKTTIAEMAGLLNLSRFHFIRAFKKSTGMPPHQFVVSRRIERAKELLTDARLSVAEVAERAGFNGVTQLARTFRQIVGTTPTSFRRNVE